VHIRHGDACNQDYKISGESMRYVCYMSLCAMCVVYALCVLPQSTRARTSTMYGTSTQASKRIKIPTVHAV
jgi:hypothetical protein